MKLIKNNIQKEVNTEIAARELTAYMLQTIPAYQDIEHLIIYLDNWWTNIGRPRGFKNAYLQYNGEELIFTVINNKIEYNDEDEDVMTDIDIDVANDKLFAKLNMTVLLLPSASQDTLDEFLYPTRIQIG
jgi:hypothetical protein